MSKLVLFVGKVEAVATGGIIEIANIHADFAYVAEKMVG
jgi:hypothetical protein